METPFLEWETGIFITNHKDTRKGLILLKIDGIIFFALISFQLMGAGCFVLPIPTGERILDGTPVKEDQSKLLEIGVTSKDDVISYLGDPTFIWKEARLFAYDWETSSWVLLVAIGSNRDGVADMSNKYVLLIQFDEQDRICRFQKVKRPDKNDRYGDLLRKWVEEDKKEKSR
jgi:hypothetical protein